MRSAWKWVIPGVTAALALGLLRRHDIINADKCLGSSFERAGIELGLGDGRRGSGVRHDRG